MAEVEEVENAVLFEEEISLGTMDRTIKGDLSHKLVDRSDLTKTIEKCWNDSFRGMKFAQYIDPWQHSVKQFVRRIINAYEQGDLKGL